MSMLAPGGGVVSAVLPEGATPGTLVFYLDGVLRQSSFTVLARASRAFQPCKGIGPFALLLRLTPLQVGPDGRLVVPQPSDLPPGFRAALHPELHTPTRDLRAFLSGR